MSPNAVKRTLSGGAVGLYGAAVIASVVAGALFLSGDGWTHEAQFVRSPVAIMAIASALMGVGGLVHAAAGRRSLVSAFGGALGAAVWSAIFMATY